MKIYFYISIFFLLTLQVSGQNVLTLLKDAEARGDEFFSQYAYNDAALSYIKAIKKKDGEDTHLLKLKLAETYVKLNDPKDAAQWYEQVLYNDRFKCDAVHYLHFAEALKILGKKDASDDMFERYQTVFNKDKRVMKRMQELKAEATYRNKIRDIKISLAPFNSDASDFSPTYDGKDLIIVSSRENNRAIQRSCSWIDGNYLDLYRVDTASGRVTHFLPKAETKYHEGPSAFKDSIMYFTKNNYDNNSVQRGKEGISKLKIYQATRDADGQWGDYKELPFNSDHYSTGHPSLSADGKTMYFSSDRPGGFGGVDLYKSELRNGKWSTPVNLGKYINTEGNEVFPHLHDDNMLFFSSNGHHGFGGLDIYYVDITHTDQHFIRNIGAPINSNYDDFGIVLDHHERTGYFSSNRKGEGRHHDDIYAFQAPKSIVERFLIEGVVTNTYDDSFIVNAKVELLDENMRLVDKLEPEFEADYSFEVAKTGKYYLRTSKANYITAFDSVFVAPQNAGQPIFWNIYLSPKAYILKGIIADKATEKPLDEVHTVIVDKRTEEVVFNGYTQESGSFTFNIGSKALDKVDYLIRIEKKGYLAKVVHFEKKTSLFERIYISNDDLKMDKLSLGVNVGELLSLNPIYFDLGKYELNPDAKVELDKIASSMKANPDMVIELNSYTDARGDANFNLKLSELRARESVKYIISRGIENSRITGRGNGENGILNGCVDEASCTEQEHSLNRRTEFNVVAM